MMGRRVALIGTCPSGQLALHLPPEWELWVCSPGNDTFPRIDLWFELHGDLDFPGEDFRSYIAWLNQQEFPQMVHRTDLFPRGRRFPIEDMVKEFGDFFFTSQPALMFAYALSQQPEEIGLFGLDMQANSEYAHQKPAMLHFAWLAMQRGVRVLCPDESEALIPMPIYGYNLNSPIGRKLRVRSIELRNEITKLDAQIARLSEKRTHFRGALDQNEWAMQTWTHGLYRETGDVQQVAPHRPHLVKEV
jgi:hypothetical protein